uniref:Uncharacterized protein n=1 Tax=Magallana gigas TaxID=29159 RepID=A0A8W8KGC1_MAGGI|nr:uncharacterized protein LOC105326097 [Crassostrea gigas]
MLRFWRRSRRRHNTNTLDNYSSGIADYSLPDGNQLKWNPLFRVNHSGRVKPFNLSINPFLHHTQELRGHVPKCLARVSQSEILMGQRVENFSSECWLQNHLHQFAHTSANDIQNSNIETAEAAEEMDDVEDDSPVGSDTERHSNTSLDNFEFESNDGDIPSEGMDNELPPDIFNYTMAVELPPYYDEPPPSYEEALAEDERRERRLYSSTRSRDAFLW